MHPVTDRLARLRKRELRGAVIVGIATGISVLAVVAIAIATADWSFGIQSRLLRAALTLTTLVCAGLAGRYCYRRVRRSLRSPAAWSLAVEQEFPETRGFLSAAVDFLERPVVGNSSSELAGSVIRIGAFRLEDISESRLRHLVDHRALLQSVAFLALMLVIVASAFSIAPDTASTAVKRWALPLAEHPWPRSTNLRWLDLDLQPLSAPALTRRVAAGEPLNLYLDDVQGSIPDDITLDHQLPNGSRARLSVRRVMLQTGHGPKEVATATIEPDPGRHRILARAGDDDRLPALVLSADPAPVAESFTITIRPPDYARRQLEVSQSSVAHLHGLAGSVATIIGTASTPLASGRVHFDSGETKPVTVSEDGREFSVEFAMTQPGKSRFWFEIADSSGLTHPQPPRFDMIVDADTPPATVLDIPEADLRITPHGVLSLKATARDDLGVANLWLELRRLEKSAEQANAPVHRHSPGPIATPTTPAHMEGEWSLQALDLEPGERFELTAVAVDARPEASPGDREGRSSPRILSIVTDDEVRQRLAAEESSIADDLAAIHGSVQRDLDELRALRAKWRAAREGDSEDLNDFKRLSRSAEDLSRRLGRASGGLGARLDRIVADYHANQFTEPATDERLKQIAGMIHDVATRFEPDVSSNLGSAIREFDSAQQRASSPADRILPGPDQAGSIDVALAEAENSRRRSADQLGQASEQLSRQNRSRDIRDALQGVVARQDALREDTAASGRELLAKSQNDISPQDRGAVAQLAERQKGVLESFLQLSQQSPGADAGKPSPDSPSDAADPDLLRASSVSDLMRRASRSLDEFSLGDAMVAHRDLDKLLHEIEREVQTSSAAEQSSLRSITQAEELVKSLAQSQADWRNAVEQLPHGTSADPARREAVEGLRQEQSNAAAAAEDLARRLQKIAPAAANPAADAALSIRRAGEVLEDATPALALEQAREAAKSLEETQEALARERQAAAVRESLTKYSQLRATALTMAARQANLTKETQEFDQVARTSGKLTRSQTRSLRRLADDQLALSGDVAALDAEAPDEVTRWVLTLASRAMQAAATGLSDRKTDSAVHARQADAEKYLRSLADSVEMSSPPQDEQTKPSGPDSAQAQPESFVSLGPQLKLLHRMQIELIAGTQAIIDADPSQQEQLNDRREELKTEQRRLAELAAALLTEIDESEPEPDSTPADASSPNIDPIPIP